MGTLKPLNVVPYGLSAQVNFDGDPSTSTTVLAVPDKEKIRTLLIIQNVSAGDGILWVEFGAAAVANSSLMLERGDALFFDAATPQDAVQVLASATGLRGKISYVDVEP